MSVTKFHTHTKQRAELSNILIIKKLAKHSRIIKTTLKLRLTVISVPLQQKPLPQDDITLLKQAAYNFR
jgi:hypothetical protein